MNEARGLARWGVSWGIAWGIAPSLCLVSSVCLAAEQPLREKTQVGLGLNYGYYLGDDEEIPNTEGPGAHGVAGYTLGLGLYIGGELNYFLGRTETHEISGVDVDIAWSMMQFGAELGYDVGLGWGMVLRPKLGVGYARVRIEADAEDVLGPGADFHDSDTYGGFVLPLGMDWIGSFGERWFWAARFRYGYTTLTVDVRDRNLQKVGETDKHASGIVFGLGGGLRF